jgi:XRE family transcriptional regulator of biofilm formation
VSNELRRRRRELDITQNQLAERVGVDQTTISDLERGRNKKPSWEIVAKIAKVLDVDPQTLFPIETGDTNTPGTSTAVNA